MLKKAAILILLLLYIGTVPGFAVNIHYCGKLITAVKIDGPANGCKSGIMDSKMKCCHEKHIIIKIKDAHQAEAHSFLAKVFSFQLAHVPFADCLLAAQKLLLEKFSERGPPEHPFDNIAVYLKNCIFRI